MPSNQAPSATPTATPTTAPVTPPPASPEPSEVAIICPTELPTTLSSVDELADRSCYGTTELAIEGWLAEQTVWTDHNWATPDWVMPISGLFADRPTAGEWTLDTLMASPYGVEVVTPPTTGIDLSGLGRWVTLRGRFNDPETLACVPGLVDTYPDEWAGPDCDRLFTVTGLEPLERPEPSCPTESPLPLATFLAADASCFIGRDVRIKGWEDVGEGFGGTGPIYPITLAPSMRFADAQLVSHRWESDLDHNPIFPITIAGSGVHFNREDLKVIVTARLGHEASEGCRPRLLEAWTWSPPISWAQHRCMHLLVITAVDIRA